MKLPRPNLAATVAVILTIFVWPLPSIALIGYVLSWTHSLAVSLCLFVLSVIPLYVLGLQWLMRKVGFRLPSTWHGRLLALVVLVAVCVTSPIAILNDFYGFVAPTSRADYRFDTCVLEDGASGGPNDATPFVCTDQRGRAFRQP